MPAPSRFWGLTIFAASAAGLIGYGCRPGLPATDAAASASPTATHDWPGKHVMVLINGSSPESAAVGNAYVAARDVPRENVVIVGTTTEDQISEAEYRSQIEFPVQKALKRNKNPIDYMVTTFGMPIRIGDEGGYSVDAFLAQIDRPMQEIEQAGFAVKDQSQVRGAVSPYFGKNEHFSHEKFGFYLVCRLAADTAQESLLLIDRSIRAKPLRGPFLLDSQPLKPKDGGYGQMERILSATAKALKTKGLLTQYDTTPAFVSGEGPLMGYASWGSNDDRFSPAAYHALRFQPGAIAETFVSTSARTIHPVPGGQSLVADLLHQGVTGVKGYVSEPFTFALCHTNVLFDRYTAGYNLAESFYMASPILKWKDIVIGDPLCAPYASKPYVGPPVWPVQAGLGKATSKKAFLARMPVGRKRPAKVAVRTTPTSTGPRPGVGPESGPVVDRFGIPR